MSSAATTSRTTARSSLSAGKSSLKESSSPSKDEKPLEKTLDVSTNSQSVNQSANRPPTTSRNLDSVVNNLSKTAEFALHAQKEYYSGHISLLRSEMESIIQSKNSEILTLKKRFLQNESEMSDCLKRHEVAIGGLEAKMCAHAERRLFEHTQAYEAKCSELEQFQLQQAVTATNHENTIETMKREFESELNELKASTSEKIEFLETKLERTEAEYEEALSQVEFEHDREVAEVKLSTKSRLTKHRENTAILVAEMSAAQRKLDEKQSSLSNLEFVVAEQDEHLFHTATVVKKLTGVLSSNKSALRVKEEDITRRQYELAGARQDNTVLKNFIEILEHRIAELENREAPALDALMAMKQRLTDMATELFECAEKQQKASEQVKRTKEESARFFSTVTALRHRLAKRDQWISTVRKEFKWLLEQNTHGSNNDKLRCDLRKLFSTVFSTNDTSDFGPENVSLGFEERDENRMQNRVQSEIDRQRRHLEKSINQMKHQYDGLANRRKADNDSNLQQNIHFLYEVNRLREENKRYEGKIASLKAIIQGQKMANKALGNTSINQSVNQSTLMNQNQTEFNKDDDDDDEQEEKQQSTNQSIEDFNLMLQQSSDLDLNSNQSINQTIIHGSTRPLWELSHFHAIHHQILDSLDDANQTINQQTQSINQLKRGIDQAIEIAQSNYFQAEAAKKRAREALGLPLINHTINQSINHTIIENDNQSINRQSIKSPFKHSKHSRSPLGCELPSLAGNTNLPIYKTSMSSIDERLNALRQ